MISRHHLTFLGSCEYVPHLLFALHDCVSHCARRRYTIQREDDFCDLSLNATDVCKDNIDSTLRKYKYVLYLGQLLIGVGATPLYTLGLYQLL